MLKDKNITVPRMSDPLSGSLFSPQCQGYPKRVLGSMAQLLGTSVSVYAAVGFWFFFLNAASKHLRIETIVNVTADQLSELKIAHCVSHIDNKIQNLHDLKIMNLILMYFSIYQLKHFTFSCKIVEYIIF